MQVTTPLAIYSVFVFMVGLNAIVDIERAWYDWRDYKAYVSRCMGGE